MVSAWLGLGLCSLTSHPAAAAPHDPVVLATLEWPPYVSADLPHDGVLVQVIREALAVEDYKLELVWLPWPRALNEAATGRVDGVMPMYMSPEREQIYLVSAPLPAALVGLWQRQSDPVEWNGHDIRSLQGLTIGVVRGYVNHPLIDAPDAGLDIDDTRTDALNLAKLAAGHVDVVVVDHLVATYLQHQDPRLADLVPVWPSFGERATYIGFSRNTERGVQLQHAFNAGLAQLQAQGRLAQIVAGSGLSSHSTKHAAAR